MSKFRLYESHRDTYQIQEWVHRPPTTYKPGVIDEGTWNWNTHKILQNVNQTYAIKEFEKLVYDIRAARSFVPRVIMERTYEE